MHLQGHLGHAVRVNYQQAIIQFLPVSARVRSQAYNCVPKRLPIMEEATAEVLLQLMQLYLVFSSAPHNTVPGRMNRNQLRGKCGPCPTCCGASNRGATSVRRSWPTRPL